MRHFGVLGVNLTIFISSYDEDGRSAFEVDDADTVSRRGGGGLELRELDEIRSDIKREKTVPHA